MCSVIKLPIAMVIFRVECILLITAISLQYPIKTTVLVKILEFYKKFTLCVVVWQSTWL